MKLPDFDFFDWWRWMLTIVCTIYASVITLRSLWEWIVYFAAPDRTTVMMRKYTIVHLLRLRMRAFSGELLGIAFWTAALIFLIYLHRF
jgi:hypothetical protein